MKHFLLIYDYVDDFREKRAPLRAAHLALGKAAAARGDLVLGGALADDPPNGVLLFAGEAADVAANFAQADPYVTGADGAAPIVRRWTVREWTTVIGAGAAAPV